MALDRVNVSSEIGAVSSIAATITPGDIEVMLDRYDFPADTREIIASENLLPHGLLSRIHMSYPQHSNLLDKTAHLFRDKEQYSGIEGFREIVGILEKHGIVLEGLPARELFIDVYRFKATRHLLNGINWDNYEADPVYQLVFPQPGMMEPELVQAYVAAKDAAERDEIIAGYMEKTNPHDGHQLLNKPWVEREDGGIDIVEGSQHKYPQCQLIFDKTTQSCFAFCTYCFRHAQVRGDEDMFIQDDIAQIHDYVRQHREITDMLITGGDAGYLTFDRMRQYLMPLVDDPTLIHVRTIRLASRMLTFQPELLLTRKYEKTLELFDMLHNSGVQVTWMAHISTPRELMNPATIAAIRRLQKHGVTVRAQSPIMNHVSLFMDGDGKVDIERSAQNWIDLGNLLATLLVRFHSMYCARPTGEHHYFTAPLADIEKISNLIFRSLSSINRPSRYITMTTSAGKVSILGECVVNGRRALALKLNEARNMAWMDRVFLAEYDEQKNRVDFLTPFDTDEFFFEEELKKIEAKLQEFHAGRGGQTALL